MAVEPSCRSDSEDIIDSAAGPPVSSVPPPNDPTSPQDGRKRRSVRRTLRNVNSLLHWRHVSTLTAPTLERTCSSSHKATQCCILGLLESYIASILSAPIRAAGHLIATLMPSIRTPILHTSTALGSDGLDSRDASGIAANGPLSYEARLAKARDMISTKESVRDILALAEDDAKATIDSLDEIVDALSGRDRLRALYVIRRLCKRHSTIPRSCIISGGIDGCSAHPLFGGGFADVYRGTYAGQAVAIKVLHMYQGNDNSALVKALCGEISVWKRLEHDNIIPFFGVSRDIFPGQLALISPWCSSGHIGIYLKEHCEANRLQLLLDICKGLDYLHGENVVHGDLKGANILVDDQSRVRLADFGLTSILLDPEIARSINPTTLYIEAGSARWMAPELFEEHGRVNKMTDVYALGMVALELFTGLRPYHEAHNDLAVIHRVTNTVRPDRPDAARLGLSDAIWNLMQACWSYDPHARPMTAEILPIVEDELGIFDATATEG